MMVVTEDARPYYAMSGIGPRSFSVAKKAGASHKRRREKEAFRSCVASY